MISAAVGRGGETMISAQTTEAFWNAVRAREAALGRAQLLARSRPDVSVSRGALGEGGRGDLLLSERRPAQSAVGDRLRSGAAGHGPLSRRVRARRADQHRRRLLRQHARAHRGHRQGARRPASAKVGTQPLEESFARRPRSRVERERVRRRERCAEPRRRSRCASPARSPSRSSPASTS